MEDDPRSARNVYKTRAVVRPWCFPRQKWKLHTDLGITPLLRHTGRRNQGSGIDGAAPAKGLHQLQPRSSGLCRSALSRRDRCRDRVCSRSVRQREGTIMKIYRLIAIAIAMLFAQPALAQKAAWGVSNLQNQVFRLDVVFKQVPGSLKQVSVGADGANCAIGSD